MEYNIILEYIEFLKNRYNEFFRIMLGNKYSKKTCDLFINKYIDVRYYNEIIVSKQNDIAERVNDELVDVYKNNVNDENIEDLKNIVSLFAYIVFFDDLYIIYEEKALIDNLVSDSNIKLENKEQVKDEILNWYSNLKDSKNRFNQVISSKDFTLVEKRVYNKLYKLDLEHNVRISNLYSEYAINKAYNSGIIYEDRLFVLYILASQLILENAINLDFTRKYVVDFPDTLFKKEKKMKRLLNIFDNTLAKKYISLKINYTDYINSRSIVEKLISNGYSFGVVLDENFDGNYKSLVIFNYVFVNKDSDYLEDIMIEKKNYDFKVVKI